MKITERKPALALRLRTAKALKNGERVTLSAAPVLRDGVLYIPTDALLPEWRADSVLIDGAEFSTKIEGVYINLDSTGLILVDPDPEILSVNHTDDKAYMMRASAEMLFDVERIPNPKAAYAPATEEERAVFARISDGILALFEARGNRHPYIFTSREYMSRLRELYESADGALREVFLDEVKWADEVAARPDFKLNADGTALADRLWRKVQEDGYDDGGRSSFAEGYAQRAMEMAFVYNLTKNEDLAIKAYYTIKEICSWEHWGPGHFLNCAGAACYAAVTYDWLYDAWQMLKLDTGAIIRGIYRLGVYEGWRSIIEDTSTYPSARQGTGWRFKHKPDNWNAVCTGGLTVACLAMLSEQTKPVFTEGEQAVIKETLGACLAYLTAGELVLMQYCPDGSYVESNTYWAYGTASLFRAIAAIYDALGTDLGLSLSLGLDKTCYYALNSESNDFVGWSYHDGHTSKQDTSIFNMFATVSGDCMLYALREDHIKRGKKASLYDLLYHPAVRGNEVPALTSLELDYFMEGIDALVVRDGWESGKLYAGIMGGYNPVGGSHNQLDSGSFVYHNFGVLWFTDLGADYYNIKEGYFGNYHLYKRCAEGNNVLSLPSVDYGQGGNCTGKITRHHSGKNAFAVIDNGTVYEDKVGFARRGMLLTNDRKTLVIQDELELTAPERAYAVAHFKSAEITAELDGRTCVMTHRDGQQIKVTLVGDGSLSVRDCYDFLLPTTRSFEGENDRSEYSRLVVTHGGTSKISSALVIEPIEENGYTAVIPMESWQEE
ncbi:MAG: hypothetical protein IKL79_05080 [Clostridia bacterium]|nr:hypothetical protein [Clostridia bacterium]